jgi:hypothetical protein
MLDRVRKSKGAGGESVSTETAVDVSEPEKSVSSDSEIE